MNNERIFGTCCQCGEKIDDGDNEYYFDHDTIIDEEAILCSNCIEINEAHKEQDKDDDQENGFG